MLRISLKATRKIALWRPPYISYTKVRHSMIETGVYTLLVDESLLRVINTRAGGRGRFPLATARVRGMLHRPTCDTCDCCRFGCCRAMLSLACSPDCAVLQVNQLYITP